MPEMIDVKLAVILAILVVTVLSKEKTLEETVCKLFRTLLTNDTTLL